MELNKTQAISEVPMPGPYSLYPLISNINERENYKT